MFDWLGKKFTGDTVSITCYNCNKTFKVDTDDIFESSCPRCKTNDGFISECRRCQKSFLSKGRKNLCSSCNKLPICIICSKSLLPADLICNNCRSSGCQIPPIQELPAEIIDDELTAQAPTSPVKRISGRFTNINMEPSEINCCDVGYDAYKKWMVQQLAKINVKLSDDKLVELSYLISVWKYETHTESYGYLTICLPLFENQYDMQLGEISIDSKLLDWYKIEQMCCTDSVTKFKILSGKIIKL